jgi:hypothetical protein
MRAMTDGEEESAVKNLTNGGCSDRGDDHQQIHVEDLGAQG